MRILTSEESFDMMQAKFNQLNVNDLIDLCYDNRRYAALVISINKDQRYFRAYRVDAEAIRRIASGSPLPDSCDIVTVFLPPSPCNIHPQWNFVGK